MADVRDALLAVMKIDGVEAAALVDLDSGQPLGSMGGGINVELEAAANADLLKTKERILKTLGYQDGVEDILITTWNSLVLLRQLPMGKDMSRNLMLFVKLRKNEGSLGINLAMTRIYLRRIEGELTI